MLLLKNNPIMHTIVSALHFEYLNIFGIDIWKNVKPGLIKR